ncbi:hypothetical protein [Streptomyces sp. TBY4]|uniref:hypothetical protein n=1 Tax=Streptomyces sp. TBY4 TaxID=2962030 RepID=UPI0020B83E65|nr:hypothetical protein [Streptomyces sp. TBY4]MCP3758193.1 hypothetical protein [Streptomyces sp. TBY4]
MNLCVCRTELTDGYLCARCRAATHGRLLRIPSLYRLLEPELQPTAAAPSYGRVRLVEAPMPVSAEVLTMRGPGGIVGVLEDWWAAMQASRAGSAPVISGTVEQRVGTAAGRLAFHLDFVVDWAEAGSLATEIRRLDERALAIVCPPDTREHGERLGPCPAETGTGAVCGAVLRYYRGSSPKKVTCPWCEVVYPPHSWADLKAWIDHDEEVLLAG